MGFSYTAAAGRMMAGIEVACAATRPEEETATNVFFVNGKRYFHEIVRRDQKDGGIIGTINLTWTDEDGQEWCRQTGTFRIDGRGRLVRGPTLFKQATPVKSSSGGRWG
jgi:hypothetical protein